MMSKSTNLITGGLESGKTRGIMFPEVEILIDEGKNLFIVDNKEEYYPRFKDELEKKDYKVYFINMRNPKDSNGINVLSYPYYLYKKSNDKDLALSLIMRFTETICRSNNKDADPFWETSAGDYLASLIIMLFDNADKEEINLHSLGKLVSILDNEEGRVSLRDYLMSLDVTSPIYRLGSTCAFAPTETRGGILSVLKSLVNPYFSRPNLLDALSINELQIEEIKDQKVAIFFEGRNFTNKIANILIEQILAEIKRNKLEFAFILDDINSLPRIYEINELIEYATFNKIKTYFITNNLSELKSKYPDYTFDKVANVIKANGLNDFDDKIINADLPKLKSITPKIWDASIIIK